MIAWYFINEGVHTNLTQTIQKSLNIYKQNNSLEDEKNPETDLQKMNKYKLFAQEIRTLGGLLNAEENREKILNPIKPDDDEHIDGHEPIILDIVSILGHEFTDPILLEAVCKFTNDLLECEEIMNNESRL